MAIWIAVIAPLLLDRIVEVAVEVEFFRGVVSVQIDTVPSQLIGRILDCPNATGNGLLCYTH
ncbi:hypothetical protein CTA1_3901 [Colletotrichum tanaceti]|uniref:Uncharacterized protein n=1 Tax=Colletotrichum tanaceti TaxID=1306861 RepID=A0A4U6XRQ5_9PEZI|nr:hypothetical protein CTA1_3901 [Colletotrichum tanaceti]